MRVAHLTSHLRQGGITRSVSVLTQELVARGHRVVVAAGSGPAEQEIVAAGGTVWPADLNTSVEFAPRVWRATECLRRRLEQSPVDILHGHTRVGQVVAQRLSKALGIPFVATWHGYYSLRLGRKLFPCTGDRTLAISRPVAEHLQKVFKVGADKIELVPHGIDLKLFSPGQHARRSALRAQLGLSDTDFLVGTVSRLVASKGVDVLVRAAEGLCAAVPGAHVLIVGEGESTEDLKALAQRSSVAERIHFAGSMPSHAVYPALDAFVFLPTDKEGFGLTLLEGLACRVPTVAVRRGPGAVWLLDSLQEVPTVPAEDDGALSSALAAIYKNPAEATARAGRLRGRVEQLYSLDGMIGKVERVYEALVDRGGGGAWTVNRKPGNGNQ